MLTGPGMIALKAFSIAARRGHEMEGAEKQKSSTRVHARTRMMAKT
jgi:hypothetical protein